MCTFCLKIPEHPFERKCSFKAENLLCFSVAPVTLFYIQPVNKLSSCLLFLRILTLVWSWLTEIVDLSSQVVWTIQQGPTKNVKRWLLSTSKQTVSNLLPQKSKKSKPKFQLWSTQLVEPVMEIFAIQFTQREQELKFNIVDVYNMMLNGPNETTDPCENFLKCYNAK